MSSAEITVSQREIFRRGLFRIAIRLALMAPWTIGLFGIRFLAMPIAVVAPALDRAVRRWIVRTWGRGAMRILGFRLAVVGPRPKPPYLLVSNHVSSFDPYIYVGILGCVFVAMAEMDSWPFIGVLTRNLGTIFINRRDRRDALRVNNLLVEAYAHGEGIVIYPEAHTGDGSEIRHFHSALLEPAAQQGWPVYYASIRHATPPGWPPASWAVCWVGDLPIVSHALRVLSMPYVETTVVFGELPCSAPDRKTLTSDLQAAVTKQFVPIE